MNKNLIKSVLFSVLILAILWVLFLKNIMNDIETLTYDWRAKIATEKNGLSHHDPNIILLAADDETTKILENYPEISPGRWPWPRKVWGEVVNYINKGNPKAIVFDLKFEGEDEKSSDNYFAQAVKGKNVIVGTALSLPRKSDDVNKMLNIIDFELRKYNQKLFNQTNETIDHYLSQVYTSLYKRSPLDERFGIMPESDYYQGLIYKNEPAREFLDNITYFERSSIYDQLIQNTGYIGVINLNRSQNTTFRSHVPLYRLVEVDGFEYVPSLPLAAVLSVLKDNEKKPVELTKNTLIIGKRQIPLDENGTILLNWHGGERIYETISLGNVIVHKIPPDYFKNKIVVIGQTTAGTDIHPTPMSSVYAGPEIITTAIDNILNDADTTNPHRRKFIVKSPVWLDALLTLLLCLFIGRIMIKTKSNAAKVQWFVATIVFYIMLAIFVFVEPQIRVWINITYPLTFMIFTGMSIYAYITHKESSERKQVEQLFGKFVSPQILDKLLADKSSIAHSGQRKVMTVLFSDIRGFTTLSEKHTPDEVIAILNEYITEMVEVILAHNGTLDKYIGDAIMAFYNDPVEMEDHALRAVLTAIDMRKKLDELNTRWKAEGKPVLNIGIGINTGEMIVGHMGSPRLVDYTVIGDNVNLASRIESLTKEYSAGILISEATYEQVKHKIEGIYRDEVVVKGKTTAVKIYEIK